MPEDQIEMRWRCSDPGCAHENKGRDHECGGCGRPKTDEDADYFPDDVSHAAAVTDPELLRAATGGVDWRCRYCASLQRRIDGACAQCGADQATGEKTTPPVESTAPVELPEPPSRARPHAKLAGALCGVLALVALLVWLAKPRQTQATVARASWSAVVHVDRYAPRPHDGFAPPAGAIDLVPDGQRVHHYDHVLTGSHDEPYQVSVACGQDCRDVPPVCRTTPRTCRSNKNGFATCTGGDRVCSGGGRSCTTRYCAEPRHRTVNDYADVPVYAPYYRWRAWEWAHERDARQNGDGTAPAFPDPELLGRLDSGESEREAGRELTLRVTFARGDETWTYTPASVEEFARYAVGTHHELKVGPLGGVEVLR